jgi:predicted RNA-binding Zn ribbon-like protein
MSAPQAPPPKAAPGRLEAVRAFINTIDREEGHDELSSPEALRGWLVANDLLASNQSIGAQDLRRAVELREHLRELALANNEAVVGARGPGIDRRVAAGIDRAAARAGLTLRMDTSAMALLEATAPGADGALGRLLAAVYAAMANGTWSRLKACRNDTCQWAFYDHSKNRSGHWCQMSACGNQQKARAYRARKRAGRQPE